MFYLVERKLDVFTLRDRRLFLHVERHPAVSAEIFQQSLSGVRLLDSRHLLRRPLGHNFPAVFAALGAKIDEPVGIANYVEIMFDDDDGVSQIGQPMQHVEQLFDIVEMKARGRLVE